MAAAVVVAVVVVVGVVGACWGWWVGNCCYYPAVWVAPPRGAAAARGAASWEETVLSGRDKTPISITCHQHQFISIYIIINISPKLVFFSAQCCTLIRCK